MRDAAPQSHSYDNRNSAGEIRIDQFIGCQVFVHVSHAIEHFGEARLIRIARGTFAIGLDPFGMLDPQIVVNLLPELGVGVDLMIHGYCPGERFKCDAG
jgi:hypothetical protein